MSENEREVWALVLQLLERNQYLTDKIVELALAKDPGSERREQLESMMQLMMLKTVNDKIGSGEAQPSAPPIVAD